MLVGHQGLQPLDFRHGCFRTRSGGLGSADPCRQGSLVGLIIRFFSPPRRGVTGCPRSWPLWHTQGGKIRPRVALAKILASGICIGVGGSAGREGPIVQIGSSLGSAIGQFLGLSSGELKVLVGCGAARGIAATFKAPRGDHLQRRGDSPRAPHPFVPLVISSTTLP
jgi:hypothetical protein